MPPYSTMNSGPLSSLRARAQKLFEATPIPLLKYGLDISFDPASFDFSSIASLAGQDSDRSLRLYEVRADGVILADFLTAFEKFPDKIAPLLGTLLHSSNKFEAFHLANIWNGLFVYVPDRTSAHSAISLPPLTSSFPHVLILAEPHSSVSIVQMHVHAPSHTPFSSSAVEVFAREHAQVHFCSIQDFPLDVVRFSFQRARVSAHAHVTWAYGEFGSRFVKGDSISTLAGENSSTKNVGILVQDGVQQADWHDAAYHLAPHSQSHLLSRAMLDGESKLVYRGLIKMVKEAKGSMGIQRADSLTLSPKAESDPVPALEIEGSDVRCTHAATVGRLDADKLFYLTSRGLDETTARALYIQGFLEHVLAHFPKDAPVPFFRSHAARKLGLTLNKEEFTPLLTEVLA